MNNRWLSFHLYMYTNPSLSPYFLNIALSSFWWVQLQSIFGLCKCCYNWAIQYNFLSFLLVFFFSYFSFYLLPIYHQTLPSTVYWEKVWNTSPGRRSLSTHCVPTGGACFPCLDSLQTELHVSCVLLIWEFGRQNFADLACLKLF